MPSAKEAAIASLSAVRAKNKEGWLALFDADAVVQDPVGASPFDPTGKGHRGHAAIGAFYDNVIAHNDEFDFKILNAFERGDECASFATFQISTRGASFEMPVALVILVLLGWVTPAQLREWRGYAVVGIFIIAAVITPPDVVSQLLLALPMVALYEAGILASSALARSRGTTARTDRRA